MNTAILNSRLRNCLLTILELEELLERTRLGESLQKEFSVLKELVERLENIAVEEQDVCRIEVATSHFLAELKGTLGEEGAAIEMSHRLLQ